MSYSAAILLLFTILPLGDGCGPGRKLSDLRKYVQFSPYSSTPRTATSPQCLNCDFEGDCCWYDDSGAPLHWALARFKQTVTGKQMKQFTGREDVPAGNYIGTGSEQGRGIEDSANLVADVPCLDQATIGFKHWKSSNEPEIEVCTTCQNNQAVPNCQQVEKARDAAYPSITVTCSPSGPAKIQIKARHFKKSDFVALDDIRYGGTFCNGGETTTKTANTLLNGCSSLTCDFERGNTCGWANKPEYGQWNVNSGREGSPLTGISTDSNGNKEGKYSFVGRTLVNQAASTSDASTTYVLQSPRFKTSSPTKLKYRVYDRSSAGQFEVCTQEGLTDCRNKVDRPLQLGSDNKWSDEQIIDLEPNKPYVLSYVVKNLPANYYFGLDNVKLEPSNGDNNACTSA